MPRRVASRAPRRSIQRRNAPPRLFQWAVDVLYGGMVMLAPPYAALRAARDAKARSRWAAYARDIPARFGRRARRASFDRPCVWVHGVSVGEVKAAARLVERIEGLIPDVEIIVTVTTDTGFRVARARYPNLRVEFYPPDLSWIVNDSLDALSPDLMILVESEFWPNFLAAARERGLPVALVNGRMSERSARRFRRFKFLAEYLLGSLEKVFVQLPVYAERFLALGVPPDRLVVTGNMKFDNIPLREDATQRDRFASMLGADDDDLPVVVAGSTHPGEERIMVRIHRRLMEAGVLHRLILVPRHPGRREAVETDVRRAGGQLVRRSELGATRTPAPHEIVLLDTVGELEAVYGLADAVFVGGTLVPHGGQNMMEPASLGRPVVVGPHVGNFRGEVAMLLQAQGLVLVQNAEGVYETLRRWLAEPEVGARLGANARDAIARSKGATERTFEGLRPLLERVAQRARARTNGERAI